MDKNILKKIECYKDISNINKTLMLLKTLKNQNYRENKQKTTGSCYGLKHMVESWTEYIFGEGYYFSEYEFTDLMRKSGFKISNDKHPHYYLKFPCLCFHHWCKAKLHSCKKKCKFNKFLKDVQEEYNKIY